ncbi:modification methylase [Snodgrassella alvi]|uniref:DNA adenine methylase n=1 Tax=Snodgrassella alvi TaxID=1196083 RepID=UPI000A014ACD|nr:DNA adenine methylase [Snodgrassella alvi]ORF02241.1 modification methylase [Snodgrassella alvi]ORF08318.1 modification methylase [Snodgrassella alvi]ORF11703.1 modification methylase [Snodgrassella alvi]ORF12608.1 modification methylase [Snodgrassella alvi]ORF20248.1 modification methylase [Snodgrassella alvi]
MRHSKKQLIAPVLKWAGGKRQLLDTLIPLVPKDYSVYCEPFVGGGALFFALQPQSACINDVNHELIRVYTVIKNDVDALIEQLKQFQNNKDQFYEIRSWDRNKDKYNHLSDIEKAARIIYLNRTCFNGLFRVNASGEFNVPFGNYANPNIVNEPVLRAISFYFNNSEIVFNAVDYAEILKNLPDNAFVYLDPPYDPVSVTANFTSYTKDGFSRDEQIKLRKCCDELNERGIKFMLSNSATDFICDQYSKYNIEIISAKRLVGADASKRGRIQEVIVRNYG